MRVLVPGVSRAVKLNHIEDATYSTAIGVLSFSAGKGISSPCMCAWRVLTWAALLGRRGQELGRVGSRSVGDLPFNMAGFPWSLSSSQLLPGQLGQLGSLSQTSSGVLSRSHEDVIAGMQRELSAERGRMGRISLSQSLEPLQQ